MPSQLAVANQPDKRRKVLDALLKREGLDRSGDTEIQPRQTAGPAPLAFAQQRLWVLDQLEPGIPLYNIQKSIRIRGPLAEAALRSAFEEVIRRHDILRTIFQSQNGHPSQVVHAPQPVCVEQLDLSHLPPPDKEQAIERTGVEAARQQFNLGIGPLVRMLLLRLDEEQHVVLLTMHHIVSDGWSIRVFMDELTVLYVAFAQGRSSPLPTLNLQYADYACWQQDLLGGDGAKRQLDFWRRTLAGQPPRIELPTDRSRPAIQTYQGAHEGLLLSYELAAELRALAQRNGSTPFMVLLSAFQLFLSRHSGQKDISVGTPFSGRTRLELEPLIGMFVNTLVLRTLVKPDWSFIELLTKVKETVLEAQANQDLPFEQVVEALGVERTLSHTPLFQVMFSLQNAPTGHESSGEARFEALKVENNMSKFELTLFMTDSGSKLSGTFEYNSHLFDRETVQRLIARFELLLTSIVRNADQPVSRLNLLPPDEFALVTKGWNDTTSSYPQEVRIHELFEQQAVARPESISVVFGDSCLTYKALNRASERVARALRATGVRPGDYVALLMDRSLETIPALLGILKAGAAYVPLELRWPRQRMRAVLESVGVRCLVTRRDLIPVCEELASLELQLQTVVCMERDSEISTLQLNTSHYTNITTADSTPSAGSDLVMYVIFTSGSTGTPKGVVVRHKPVSNLLHWANRLFSLTPFDRVLCVASLSFDLSVYDIFGMLAAGGVVQLASDDDIQDPEQLIRLLAEYPITLWDSAPAALQQLSSFLHLIPVASSHSLRLVFLSGDWIPLSLPTQLRATFSRAQVIALGGATEATVWSNSFAVPEQINPHWVSIPYGRPIDNARYYVLDPSMMPCPIGVAGDLYIAGECLADGYISDPGQTAERFVPDPFAASAARAYRTGDTARFWPDGIIEFLGRKDHQVKVRGYRIELGEIETALREHHGVREAVVQARESAVGDKRLVGYIVPSGNTPPSTSELRTWLRERLPEYMIPSAWVSLLDIPRSATGKLDRRALPEPVWGSDEQGTDGEAATEVEQKLVRIWSQVLRIERVGLHQNFFELGGDSILSIQIVARAHAEGIGITAKQLFQYQTIAELAPAAEAASFVIGGHERVTGPVALTPIQQWFFEQDWIQPSHFNQAVLLEARQPVSEVGLRSVVHALVEHHDALRTRFDWDETHWRQEVLRDVALDPVTIETVSDSRDLEHRASEWQRRFELNSGMLLRVVLFRMNTGEADRLLLIGHHLVVDGVSWRLLLEDLERGYQRWRSGKPPELPPKTASFQQWAEHLNELAATRDIEAEWPYWEEQCSARESYRTLHPSEKDERNHTVTTTLDQDDTLALLQEVPVVYGTQINDVLLTAVASALGCEDELSVELEGHGRGEESGLETFRTVGWFTVQYPVKLRLSCGESVSERLKSVKEQLRKVPRGGLGYGLLRYLGRDHQRRQNLKHQPQITFNYLGQLDGALKEEGLFIAARERTGAARSPRYASDPALRVSGFVAHGVLRMSFSWSTQLFSEARVRGIADAFTVALRKIIQHCRNTNVAGYTPSDFPLAGLDQQSLENLLSKIEF